MISVSIVSHRHGALVHNLLVDLSARLKLAGKRAVLCPGAEAIHDAHRQSHRSLRYLRWHLASMLRFFASAPFRRPTAIGPRA